MEVTPGFVLLAAWFALINGGWTLLLVLGAAAVHELGHWLVLRAFGAPVHAFRLSVFGAELSADCQRLSYPEELTGVLAGPGANLAAAFFLAFLGQGRWTALVGANLVLAVFNLLPVRPLDGGQAVRLAVSWLAGPEAGDCVLRLLSGLTAGFLTALLAWLIYKTRGSLWLLPALFGTLCAALSECRPAIRKKRGCKKTPIPKNALSPKV